MAAICSAADRAPAEMRGLGPGADADRDRLRRGQRARGRLQLELAVQRPAVAQFAEDGDDAHDLLHRGAFDRRQAERWRRSRARA